MDSSKYIPIFGWDTPKVDGFNPSILISNVVEQSKSIRNHHFSHPLVMRIETTYPGIPRYPICYFHVLLLKQWFPYIAGKTIQWLVIQLYTTFHDMFPGIYNTYTLFCQIHKQTIECFFLQVCPKIGALSWRFGQHHWNAENDEIPNDILEHSPVIIKHINGKFFINGGF